MPGTGQTEKVTCPARGLAFLFPSQGNGYRWEHEVASQGGVKDPRDISKVQSS